jgi:hypothetical protein
VVVAAADITADPFKMTDGLPSPGPAKKPHWYSSEGFRIRLLDLPS